jgi:hypothetical protein
MNYPVLGVFWTMLEFFAFVVYIWLIFTIATDIFRSDDLSGWGKAAWLVFILFLPFIGMFTYLIARGRSMQERAMQVRAQHLREQEILRAHMVAQQTGQPAGQQQGPTSADQLSRLADLRQRGVLSAEEFDREKAKVLSQS